MYYIVKSRLSFEKSCVALEESVKKYGFGVLHVHNIKNTLQSKGVEFDEECKIFEVCNPQHASKVLADDMRLNMALPCRVSVYTDGADVMIGMLEPSKMLSALSVSPALKVVADEVQETMIAIIEDAKEGS